MSLASRFPGHSQRRRAVCWRGTWGRARAAIGARGGLGDPCDRVLGPQRHCGGCQDHATQEHLEQRRCADHLARLAGHGLPRPECGEHTEEASIVDRCSGRRRHAVGLGIGPDRVIREQRAVRCRRRAGHVAGAGIGIERGDRRSDRLARSGHHGAEGARRLERCCLLSWCGHWDGRGVRMRTCRRRTAAGQHDSEAGGSDQERGGAHRSDARDPGGAAQVASGVAASPSPGFAAWEIRRTASLKSAGPAGVRPSTKASS